VLPKDEEYAKAIQFIFRCRGNDGTDRKTHVTSASATKWMDTHLIYKPKSLRLQQIDIFPKGRNTCPTTSPSAILSHGGACMFAFASEIDKKSQISKQVDQGRMEYHAENAHIHLRQLASPLRHHLLAASVSSPQRS
jgi:hypothetical protein